MSDDHPKMIGRFQLAARLGQGAMGTVYRAVQEPLGRIVALKLLSPHLAAQPGFCDRFLREARAAAAIVHPNVIACYDTGEDQGYYYMALELATGGDLDEQVQTGPIEQSRALSWLCDCARGLQAIADAGLLHRDIKPANIFLGQDGSAKIADLGLARLASGDDMLTQAGAIMGTPAYMSPEQARGLEGVDIRSDIYALGATLYKLLTGQVPFQSDSPLGTLHRVVNDPLPDPRQHNDTIADEVVAILAKTMAKVPQERYQNPRDLLADCESARQGRPIAHALGGASSMRLLSLPAQVQREVHSERITRIEEQSVAAPQPQKGAQSPAPRPAAPAEPTAQQPGSAYQRSRSGGRLRVSKARPDISRTDLAALLKRIHFDETGLTAWMNLAPGACFPRNILDLILEESGVVHGCDEAAINAATRPAQQPRRIVFARGDRPSPGLAGKNIFGERIDPLVVPIELRVTDDAMMAIALMQPNTLVESELAKRVIKQKGICFGIDAAAAKRLYEGPPDPGGRVVVARGRPGRPGIAAGFHLCNEISNTTLDNLVTHDLSHVNEGQVLAIWHEGVCARDGMDVYGKVIAMSEAPERKPDDYTGEGTEIARDGEGQLILRATRDGLCQQQHTGAIRVVRACEVAGDLSPESGPLVSEDLIVVRGSVRAGAQIQSASDVVIMGDLEDAEVQCSGSLQVEGVIGSGDATVIAADQVVAEGIEVRRVMAGGICIRGTVRNCDLLATGDIEIDEVIGGSLQAGGNIVVKRAGDPSGATTELWAGHNLDYQQQNEMAVVAERKLTIERERLVSQRKEISGELRNLSTRQQRLLTAGGFIDRQAARAITEQHQKLQREHERIEHDSEIKRRELSQRRQVLSELDNLADNAAATVMVSEVVNKGVVVKVANADAQVIRAKRRRFEMRLGE